jgi:hypothetical protein
MSGGFGYFIYSFFMQLNKYQLERIAFGKYLLAHADIHSKKGYPLSSFSILIIHDLIEIFLQVALECYCPEEQKKRSNILTEMTGMINARLKNKDAPVISILFIQRINELRNPMKHASIFGDSSVIKDLYSETKTFLKDFSDSLFNIDYDKLSLSSLIQSKDIKLFVEEAEDHFANGEIIPCMISVTKAYHWLEFAELLILDKYGKNLFKIERMPRYESSLSVRSSTMGGNSTYDPTVKHLAEKVTEDIARLQAKIFSVEKAISFDIDYKKFLYFRSLIPYESIRINAKDGKLQFLEPHAKYIEQELSHCKNEDAKFCLDFLVEVTLKMENNKLSH